MEDIKQILVVSRSTASCKKAFGYGVLLARSLGAKVSVLHIEYDPLLQWGGFAAPRLVDLEEAYKTTITEVRKEIDDMIRAERAQGIINNEVVKAGEPVHEILAAVENEKADLLIMAAHDEGRIEHIVYGRFNHEIVRRLPCSICLVKGD
jgi:universal stress protein A